MVSSDGRRIVFDSVDARPENNEVWVMEHFLPELSAASIPAATPPNSGLMNQGEHRNPTGWRRPAYRASFEGSDGNSE